MRTLKTSLHHRLTAYAAAGAAAAAAVAAPANTHATVISFDPPDITIPNTLDGIYINFVTHVTGSNSGAVPGFDFNPYSSSVSLLFYWGGDAGTVNGGLSLDGLHYAKLDSGAVVGPAGTFLQTGNGSNNETVNFRTGGTGYLGVKFTNESTGVVDYGYVHLSTTAGTGFPASILDYAYENTGTAITIPTAAVPEPGTVAALGALSLGAVGLRSWRRRQPVA